MKITAGEKEFILAIRKKKIPDSLKPSKEFLKMVKLIFGSVKLNNLSATKADWWGRGNRAINTYHKIRKRIPDSFVQYKQKDSNVPDGSNIGRGMWAKNKEGYKINLFINYGRTARNNHAGIVLYAPINKNA